MPGDDIDHPVHGVGAPNRSARSANHFDPLDVFQGKILLVPQHCRKRWLIQRASVDQSQDLVGVERIEPTDTDRPLVGIDLRHLYTRHQAQQVGNIVSSRGRDVLARDHIDRRAHLGERLILVRCRCHSELHQVFRSELADIPGGRTLRRFLPSRDGSEEASCCNHKTQPDGNPAKGWAIGPNCAPGFACQLYFSKRVFCTRDSSTGIPRRYGADGA